MDWHNTTCERCGEKCDIAWVVFSDIIQDRVCDSCGQVALDIRRNQSVISGRWPELRLPGAIRVVPFMSSHYAD